MTAPIRVGRDAAPGALDGALALLDVEVGYGELGLGGSLGYDGGVVRVGGRNRGDALSTHPPARLRYHLGGRGRRFRTSVALNDGVPAGSHAFFDLALDGRVVASSGRIVAGAAPREMTAELTGGHMLELSVSTDVFECAHAVWLDPRLETAEPDLIADCLGRSDVERPVSEDGCDTCVATLASTGYEGLLDDLLTSLVEHGGLDDACVTVFLLGEADAAAAVAEAHGARIVRCRPRRVSMASKAVLYSSALFTRARHYICLDADMLVLGDLTSIVAMLDALPDDRIAVCREGNSRFYPNLEAMLGHAYGGKPGDVAAILGEDRGEGGYRLVANDGLLAGSRHAMLKLDATIRAMPGALAWLADAPHIAWRNQAVLNLALARMDCGVELDPRFNLQLHTTDVDVDEDLAVSWQGEPVRVLHFNGVGRHRHRELARRYGARS